MAQAARKMPKTLEQIVAEANKNKSATMSLGVPDLGDYERIPFTIPNMNFMTYGGLPKGKIVEFFGKEGGGKTTTALNFMGSAQKEEPNKRVAFVDVEHTFDPIWAKKMGVDCESLFLYDPDVEETAGQILDNCLALIETSEFSVIVLDSIATLVSAQEMGNDIDEKTYAGVAGELTRFSKKAVSRCKRTDTIFIGINQLREEMNSQYVANRTPGGKGWKHFNSIRIEFTPGSFIDQEGKETSQQCENPMGQLIKARLVKSKNFPGNRKIVTYTLNYIKGLDIVADVLDCAVNLGVIQKAGAWFKWFDEEGAEKYKWQGRVAAQESISSDEEVFKVLSSIVNTKLSSS